MRFSKPTFLSHSNYKATEQSAHVKCEMVALQTYRRMRADAEWQSLEEKLLRTEPGWKDTQVLLCTTCPSFAGVEVEPS
jgi:hypothetical protein